MTDGEQGNSVVEDWGAWLGDASGDEGEAGAGANAVTTLAPPAPGVKREPDSIAKVLGILCGELAWE